MTARLAIIGAGQQTETTAVLTVKLVNVAAERLWRLENVITIIADELILRIKRIHNERRTQTERRQRIGLRLICLYSI